jgi:hypothetical protein
LAAPDFRPFLFGAVGATSSGSTAGNGGVGSPNSISGCAVFYSGGGAGGLNNPGTRGTGGNGGGGSTSPVINTSGNPGTANTGGGGGGGWLDSAQPTLTSGSGGSGIVIIRGPAGAVLSATPGTNTVTTLPAPAGGCKVATFTVSGTLTTG